MYVRWEIKTRHRHMEFLIYPSTIFRETIGNYILVFVRSLWANQNPTSVFVSIQNLKTKESGVWGESSHFHKTCRFFVFVGTCCLVGSFSGNINPPGGCRRRDPSFLETRISPTNQVLNSVWLISFGCFSKVISNRNHRH